MDIAVTRKTHLPLQYSFMDCDGSFNTTGEFAGTGFVFRNQEEVLIAAGCTVC